jgi:hypothetical protein
MDEEYTTRKVLEHVAKIPFGTPHNSIQTQMPNRIIHAARVSLEALNKEENMARMPDSVDVKLNVDPNSLKRAMALTRLRNLKLSIDVVKDSIYLPQKVRELLNRVSTEIEEIMDDMEEDEEKSDD